MAMASTTSETVILSVPAFGYQCGAHLKLVRQPQSYRLRGVVSPVGYARIFFAVRTAVVADQPKICATVAYGTPFSSILVAALCRKS